MYSKIPFLRPLEIKTTLQLRAAFALNGFFHMIL